MDWGGAVGAQGPEVPSRSPEHWLPGSARAWAQLSPHSPAQDGPRAPPGVQARTRSLCPGERSPQGQLLPLPWALSPPQSQFRGLLCVRCDLGAPVCSPEAPQAESVHVSLGCSGSGLRGLLGHRFLSHQDEVRAVLAPGRPVPFWAGERVPPLWVPSLVAGALLPLCVPSAVRKRGLFSVGGKV